MKTYQITFDLKKQSISSILKKELEKLKPTQVLEFTWLFNAETSNCPMLTERFKQFVEPDDRILVSEIIDATGYNQLADLSKIKN